MSGESVPVTLPTVFTIGHSTRDLDTFIQMLRVHGVTHLVDVRTIPRSRHNPQFNRDTLPEALRLAGIAYTHMEQLGGLRHARPDSPNTGWHNSSFRGFADYIRLGHPTWDCGLSREFRRSSGIPDFSLATSRIVRPVA